MPYFGGAGDGTRTRDSLLGRQVLYQLSYSREQRSGRGDRIRTYDPSVPNAVRYQLRHTPTARSIPKLACIVKHRVL